MDILGVTGRILEIKSKKFGLIIANCADPVEMQHYAAFHLVLHCLPKYPLGFFQYING